MSRPEALVKEDAPAWTVLLKGQGVWKLQAAGLVALTFMSFFPKLFHLEEYLFFVLLLIALLGVWAQGKQVWVRTPLDLPLLLLLAWVLLSVPFAIDPDYSFSEWRKLAGQVLVFYWALLVLRRAERQLGQRMVVAVLFGTLVICGYALIDFLVEGGTLKDRTVRARAPGSDYNWLSTYLVITVPLIVAAWQTSRARWQRVVLAGLGVLTLLGQGLSYTRAGWLATLVEGLFFGLLTKRRWLTRAIILFCVVTALGLSFLAGAGYQQQTLSLNTLHYRMAVWGLMAEELLAHPIVGIGYGNYTYTMRFGDLPESHDAGGFHSLFFMMATGAGIPALAFLLWTFTQAVLILLHGAKRLTKSSEYPLRTATAVMIVGFAVRNIFDNMWMGSLAFLFWILVAQGITIQNELPSRSS